MSPTRVDSPLLRPGAARPKKARLVAAALVAAVSLPACTGENLFTGIGAFAGLLGPEVEITAPQANLALQAGVDSVQVTANVSSPDGVNNVKFSGTFTGGATAFTEIQFTLPSPQDTTVSRYMKQVGNTLGTVRIVVEAKDVSGDSGADTVTVVIQ